MSASLLFEKWYREFEEKLRTHWSERDAPPTPLILRLNPRIAELSEYLAYRRCGYQMSRMELICYILDLGIRQLEKDERESRKARGLPPRK